MIQVVATHPKGYARIERLFPRLNNDALDHIESMESEGFSVSILNLPAHIDTPERLAAYYLDQFSDMYQDKNELFN
jgi:hypothetical protein